MLGMPSESRKADLMRKDYYNDPGAPRANKIVAAASAIVERDKQIILQRRKDSGLWSLPGGVMEIGERIADTCVREVLEETGLKVRIVRLLGVYSDPNHVIAYSDGEIRQQFSLCFVCYAEAGSIQLSSESTRVQWFALSSLPSDIPATQMIRINDYLTAEGPFIR